MSKFNSIEYWETRYKNNGNSGLGSYGDECDFKAKYINVTIREHNIKTINDFGCGDSNQISKIKGFDNYYGYDVSKTILDKCKLKFSDNEKYTFLDDVSKMKNSDITMSLDVTYHITEEDNFEIYMNNLFTLSKKYVLIYSVNSGGKSTVPHIKHRNFVEWVNKNYSEFKVIDKELFKGKTNGVGFYLFEKE